MDEKPVMIVVQEVIGFVLFSGMVVLVIYLVCWPVS
jgi:hypothetical protein